MKKTTLAIVCLLGCTALSLSAQEAEKKQLHEIKVKFDKVPDGLANYYSGYYYYNGKEIYNMRNYLMYPVIASMHLPSTQAAVRMPSSTARKTRIP